MKDTSIKGNGKSSIIKAPSDMPDTFAAWREQLLAGQGYLDVQLNTDTTGANAGCNEVGTALNKANLLSDTTKAALELSQSDPTVNDALYALSQKGSPAEVHVIADNGTQVTMTKGGKTLTAMVSGGEAVLYPTELGEWTIKYTFDSSQKTKQWKLEVIGIVYVYPFTIGDNLNDTDWADIDICGRLGMAQQFFKVGDSKTVNIGGTNYEVQIIGFNHDDKVSGGKAAYSFQLVDCLNQTQQMNTGNTNTGGWNGSAMRGRMSTYKSQLPALFAMSSKPSRRSPAPVEALPLEPSRPMMTSSSCPRLRFLALPLTRSPVRVRSTNGTRPVTAGLRRSMVLRTTGGSGRLIPATPTISALWTVRATPPVTTPPTVMACPSASAFNPISV